MSAERRKVLEMLSDGKITVDEAEKLLRALAGPEVPDRQADTKAWPPQFDGFFSEMKDVIGDMDHDLRSTFSRACLLYTSPSPRDGLLARMPSSA